MKKKLAVLFGLLVFFSFNFNIVFATVFKIQKIEIQGLQRVSREAVLRDLIVQEGSDFDTDTSYEVIQSLYETGFFSQIELGRSENNLVIKLQERPSIGELTVTGVRNKTNVNKILKEHEIYKGRIFKPNQLTETVKAIEQHYLVNGQYGVKVNSCVTSLSRNRVAIKIEIYEGSIAKICEIRFIGNQVFSSRQLQKNMLTKKKSLLGLITKSDRYIKDKLEFDLDQLGAFYANQGYLDFQIESSQVSLTPDKKNIFITIQVSEGNQYTFGCFKLTGELSKSCRKKLHALVASRMCEGSVYSRQILIDLKTDLEKELGNAGYYFAEVTPIPNVDEAARRVDMNFMLDPKNKIQVRRIEIIGNQVTQDRVVRRELRQMESSLISSQQIERGKERLLNRGYASEIEIKTEPVPDQADCVDVWYHLKENKQNRIEFNLGYSPAEKFLYTIALNQENFFGTGKRVNLTFNKTRVSTIYNIGYYNPYFTLNEIGFGWNIYYNKYDYTRVSQTTEFSTNNYGIDLAFGMPLSEYDALKFQTAWDHIDLQADSSEASTQVRDFLQGTNGGSFGPEIGRFSHDEFSVQLGWNHNSLDAFMFPTSGYQQGIALRGVMPVGSSLKYYIASLSNMYYYPLNGVHACAPWILKWSGEVAYGDGWASNRIYPFFRHFYLGGAESVRGFEERSLGPRDSKDNAFGGNFKVYGSLSLIFPNPIVPTTKSIRTAVFLDAGQVYDTRTPNLIKPGGLRYSVGVSVVWNTPLGAPILLSAGYPLNLKTGSKGSDRKQIFSFTFTTSF